MSRNSVEKSPDLESITGSRLVAMTTLRHRSCDPGNTDLLFICNDNEYV